MKKVLTHRFVIGTYRAALKRGTLRAAARAGSGLAARRPDQGALHRARPWVPRRAGSLRARREKSRESRRGEWRPGLPIPAARRRQRMRLPVAAGGQKSERAASPWIRPFGLGYARFRA